MSIETKYTPEALESINGLDNLVWVLKDMNISRDVDGVELGLVESALAKLNQLKGTKYGINLIDSYWAFVKLLEQNHPEIEDPMRYSVNLWHTEEVLMGAQPLEGFWASDYVEKKLGENKIWRITSRPNMAKQHTIEWFRANKPWVSQESILMQDGDQTGLAFKVAQIRAKSINIHFEDSFEHAQAIIEATENDLVKPKVVMIPQYWNIAELQDKANFHPRILVPSKRADDVDKLVNVHTGILSLL